MHHNYTAQEIDSALDDAAQALGGEFEVYHKPELFVSPRKTQALDKFLKALPERDSEPPWPTAITSFVSRLEVAAGTYGHAAEWLEPLVEMCEAEVDVQLVREIMHTTSEKLKREESHFDDIHMTDQQVVVYFIEGRGYFMGKPKWFSMDTWTFEVGGHDFTIYRSDYESGKYKIYRTPHEGPEPEEHQFIKNVRVHGDDIRYDFGVGHKNMYLLFVGGEYTATTPKSHIEGWEPAELVDG